MLVLASGALRCAALPPDTSGSPVCLSMRCSSLVELGGGASLSQGMGKRVWPFTLDHGVPLACDA